MLRKNVNASTLTWLKIHKPTGAVAALMHFQWTAPWFQEFSLPDIRVHKSRLTSDRTNVTQPSCCKWNCGLDRRPTTRQSSAPYSAWPPFEERQRLNFLLCGLCWIWGFANPESNLSSGPLATVSNPRGLTGEKKFSWLKCLRALERPPTKT